MARWFSVGLLGMLLSCGGSDMTDAVDASSPDARVADADGGGADAGEGTIAFVGQTYTLGNAAVIELPPGQVPSFIEVLNVADTCDAVINETPMDTFNGEDQFVLLMAPFAVGDTTDQVNGSVRIINPTDNARRFRTAMSSEDVVTVVPTADGFDVSFRLSFTVEVDDDGGNVIDVLDPPAVIDVTRPAPFCPPQP